MEETSPPPEDRPPEWVQDALVGRFASLVHIMKGRHSIRSGLGVLTLDRAATLSLTDASGASLFSVPVASVDARQQRRFSFWQVFFMVHAEDRWWYLTAHVLSKYSRRSTRELAALHGVREQLPQPIGMDTATYLRRIKQPSTHQLIWKACWLQALNMLAKHDDPI